MVERGERSLDNTWSSTGSRGAGWVLGCSRGFMRATFRQALEGAFFLAFVGCSATQDLGSDRQRGGAPEDASSRTFDGGGMTAGGSEAGPQEGGAADAPGALPFRRRNLVAAGDAFSCAVTSTGAAKCWGSGLSGQLGDGEVPALSGSPKPVAVKGLTSGVITLSARSEHTCAVTAAGTVYCWGHNPEGEAGVAGVDEVPIPHLVDSLGSDVIDVAAGVRHTCVLLTLGRVACWGRNLEHQLGNDAAGTRTATPVRVNVMGATAIAAGAYHTCVLAPQGVSCWGTGDQLGPGGFGRDSELPVLVPGTAGATDLSATYDTTCALNASGGIACWGSPLRP